MTLPATSLFFTPQALANPLALSQSLSFALTNSNDRQLNILAEDLNLLTKILVEHSWSGAARLQQLLENSSDALTIHREEIIQAVRDISPEVFRQAAEHLATLTDSNPQELTGSDRFQSSEAAIAKLKEVMGGEPDTSEGDENSIRLTSEASLRWGRINADVAPQVIRVLEEIFREILKTQFEGKPDRMVVEAILNTKYYSRSWMIVGEYLLRDYSVARWYRDHPGKLIGDYWSPQEHAAFLEAIQDIDDSYAIDQVVADKMLEQKGYSLQESLEYFKTPAIQGDTKSIPRLKIPILGWRNIRAASSRQELGAAYFVAGGAEGVLGLEYKDASLVMGKSLKGGRDHQQDGIYAVRFALKDGTEVKIMALSDGAGGVGGGEIASSTWLQGINEGVMLAAQKGIIPDPEWLYNHAVDVVLVQRELHFQKEATGTGVVVVIVGDQASLATGGDSMAGLFRRLKSGRYRTEGYSGVDANPVGELTNTISEKKPNLYYIKGLTPEHQLIIASDGFWQLFVELKKLNPDHPDVYGEPHRESFENPRESIFGKYLYPFFEELGFEASQAPKYLDTAEQYLRENHWRARGNPETAKKTMIASGGRLREDNISVLAYQPSKASFSRRPALPKEYRHLERVVEDRQSSFFERMREFFGW